LLKYFLGRGLPLSSGFRNKHYEKWGGMLEGATGDIVGKVADDIHYEFMRQFIDKHPAEGRKLDSYVKRAQSNGKPFDATHVKRTIGHHMKVTPEWVDRTIAAKLAEPIIREQIDTAKRVYAEAKQVMVNLHKRQDAASGLIIPGEQPRHRQNLV